MFLKYFVGALKTVTETLASVLKAVEVKEETWRKRDKWASVCFPGFPKKR